MTMLDGKIMFDVRSNSIPQYDPALGAVLAVNKTMDEFDRQYGSRWVAQSPINHTKHAVDHVLNIQNYLISQPDGYYAKVYDLREEVEHAITRLGMLWFQLYGQQERASEEAPSEPIDLVETTEDSTESEVGSRT
jgi:hypothetical protein